jgi:hypothetical protein
MKPKKFLVSVPLVLILASAAAASAQQESGEQSAATSPDACDAWLQALTTRPVYQTFPAYLLGWSTPPRSEVRRFMPDD